MTKLEEILETKLPIALNKNYILPSPLVQPKTTIYPGNLEKAFRYGDNFMLQDYPELGGLCCDSYCLIGKDGNATLSILNAYQITPKQHIPYVELRLCKSCCAPQSIFLIISGETIIQYMPTRGNNRRCGTFIELEDSKVFDIDWEDKNVLEKSDLLYIMKDLNRPALSKYLLRDIYNAFQEYKNHGIEGILRIDRDLCVSEIEEAFILKS